MRREVIFQPSITHRGRRSFLGCASPGRVQSSAFKRQIFASLWHGFRVSRSFEMSVDIVAVYRKLVAMAVDRAVGVGGSRRTSAAPAAGAAGTRTEG